MKKRENYRKTFDNFNPLKISNYDKTKINGLLENSGIVINKLKINSTIKNAKVFLKIQKDFGSFSKYIWFFTNYKTIENNFGDYKEAPTKTEISDIISKDLKNKGMSFVGSTIIYAYMQSIGIVNDHQVNCFCRNKNEFKK